MPKILLYLCHQYYFLPAKLTLMRTTTLFLIFFIFVSLLFSGCKRYERVFIFQNKEFKLLINEKTLTISAEIIDIAKNQQIIEYGHVWSSTNKIPEYNLATTSKNGILNAPKLFETTATNLKIDSTYYVRAYALTSTQDTLYTPVQPFLVIKPSNPLSITAISQLSPSRLVARVQLDCAAFRQQNPSYSNTTANIRFTWQFTPTELVPQNFPVLPITPTSGIIFTDIFLLNKLSSGINIMIRPGIDIITPNTPNFFFIGQPSSYILQ